MAYEDVLPTRLRMERARVKLTQAQVAEKTELTAAAICQYENGDRTPTIQKLQSLAMLYNVSLDYLTGRE